MTDLAQFIQQTPLADTHEHIRKEAEYVEHGPDVLQDLFYTYIGIDLTSAGLAESAASRLANLDGSDWSIEDRWQEVQEYWGHCRYTSYGQAMRLSAKLVYGIDEITLPNLLAAAEINARLRQPGERLRLLREVANLEYVQIDDQTWPCLPDPSGPEFFLYDLSWSAFCEGIIRPELQYETQIDVCDLASLRQAIAVLFAKYGSCAIAVKSAHAYERTLAWHERTDAEAEAVLQKVLRDDPVSASERLCLGDWCWARGVEQSIEYRLPFKIHTGILALNNIMLDPDRLRPAHLCPLLGRYPEARFVLMHLSYPYTPELITVAKHFPNVFVDFCWGWTIDFRHAIDTMRRLIHTVPVNKIFAFGGDTFFPAQAVGYAAQARDGLTRALQAEINEGWLTEADAISIASRVMRENQAAVFDLVGTRAALRRHLEMSPPSG